MALYRKAFNISKPYKSGKMISNNLLAKKKENTLREVPIFSLKTGFTISDMQE